MIGDGDEVKLSRCQTIFPGVKTTCAGVKTCGVIGDGHEVFEVELWRLLDVDRAAAFRERRSYQFQREPHGGFRTETAIRRIQRVCRASHGPHRNDDAVLTETAIGVCSMLIGLPHPERQYIYSGFHTETLECTGGPRS